MVYALKSIFLFNYPIWVCILAPFVQMSERSFYNAEIIKESKTRMEIFHNPPIQVEEHTTSFAENVIAIANKVIVSLLFTAANSRQKGA